MMDEVHSSGNSFGDKTFYEVFGLEKTASDDQIKKAYYRLALKHHPDKNAENRTQATIDFQYISKIYEILSNSDSRQIYDETGIISHTNLDDMSPEDQLTILLERFQSHKPSSTDIQEALAELIPGNEEEQADLKKYYEKFKGDMKKVIQCVPGCEKQDLPRLCETIREWIKTEIVEDFPLFQKTQVSDKIVPQKRQQSTRDPKAKARKKAKI